MERTRRWRRRAMRAVAVAFFLLVAALILDRARSIDWPAVLVVLRRYEPGLLLQALVITVIGHAAFAAYDLLGRRYAGHALPGGRVMAIAAVGYAFNLNLGALLGGMGFRYRLYSRYGLATGQIARVIALGVTTNWSGYLLIAGLLFLLAPPPLPAGWALATASLRGIGAVLLVMLAAWALLCARGGQRSWTIRHIHLRLPTPSLLLAQLALSVASWLAIALVIDRLLPPAVPLLQVMGTLYLSTLATLILRIPGGLGVVEAVFLALLGARYPASELLAALLAWRALYYLLPLLLALPAYALLERQVRHRRASTLALPT